MSYVPFLAVRPDEQFSADIKTRDRAPANGLPTAASTMQSAARLPAAAESRLPAALRFPLICLLSLGLSFWLNTIASPVTGPDLAAVSRPATDTWQIAALYVWRLSQLGVAWYSGYDFLDLGYLTLLNNVPFYFLLNTFYGIGFTPLFISLVIDIAAFMIPFALLRRVSRVNRPTSYETPNQEVAWDRSIRSMVTFFGAAVYAIVVYSSFSTWLPQYMVVNFDGLRSVNKAHDSALLSLLIIFVPMGFAVAQFIFVPAISSTGNPGITDPAINPAAVPFDPETATLSQTLAWNLGLSNAGYTRRAEIVVKRSVTLAICCFVNTFVRTYVTLEGTEIVGSLGWASVWAVAASAVGVAYSWVGNE